MSYLSRLSKVVRYQCLLQKSPVVLVSHGVRKFSRSTARNNNGGPDQVRKKGLLERLGEGPVVGDGSYVFTLERRGYVLAGPWTPEVVIEHPEAVKSLHREYLHAGADVLQASTFYSSDDKLTMPGHEAGRTITCKELNDKACTILKEVSGAADVLLCGAVSPTPSYLDGKGKTVVQQEYSKQLEAFIQHDLDFLLAEFIGHVEEAEWAIELMKTKGKPVACTLRIGPKGDCAGVSAGECAVRMADAGADVIGINCQFDPNTGLKTMSLMKAALEKEGLSPYLMMQPLGFHCPEVEHEYEGYQMLPECPFALEPRQLTRFEVHTFARAAYELGVRYIGGCCGFEPHHIRAISEELSPERGGKLGEASKKHVPWGGALKNSMLEPNRNKGSRQHWERTKPASGRPGHPDVQPKLINQ
ncbi:PREDICTED: betaine--homocysteine S-methyltransferase 1-like [Branchiostoma belcheri]|uniref:Betaine--homocysteine S-methyltransferase 1-like n=1 Tax=Branchiostoma belcheri TaxID=7741 RepID=A0A6P4ZFW6_BRABE|nr:PREDICTED: betaine--homocysteine S-methyltransferase 1-like [Branchiostoma belcheri]XP_019629988.1 PREDICTED: betaine--homocysteine S-methyltransferase 1-like [Branchiostoma belcheri]